MTHRFARLRRFRFNLPAAHRRRCCCSFSDARVSGSPATRRSPTATTSTRAAAAKRGRSPRRWPAITPRCGNIHDGILAYRVAGLPLTLNLLCRARPRSSSASRKTASSRQLHGAGKRRVEHLGTAPPDDPRPAAAAAAVPLLRMRARRQDSGGSRGVSTAIWADTRPRALLLFSRLLKACVSPNPEILAALGVYGGVYTCIGVAHAMQGPRRKWRPRIVLLTVALWRSPRPHTSPLCRLPHCWALCSCSGSPKAAAARCCPLCCSPRPARCCSSSPATAFRRTPSATSSAPPRDSSVSLEPARRFFSTLQCRHHVAAAASALLYLGLRRSRYFGNTAPLLCFLVLIVLVTTGVQASPWLWSCRFLLTFIGGVFADAFESHAAKSFVVAAACLVALQVVFCILSLPGLI